VHANEPVYCRLSPARKPWVLTLGEVYWKGH
jgi:hypothetical protein